jgi:hypothetical protein
LSRINIAVWVELEEQADNSRIAINSTRYRLTVSPFDRRMTAGLRARRRRSKIESDEEQRIEVV